MEKDTIYSELNETKKKNDKLLSNNSKLELEVNIFRAEIKNLKHQLNQKDEVLKCQQLENQELSLLISEECEQKKS